MRVLLLFAIALTGCATSKDVYLPDGTKGYTVSCDGAALNWNLCYEKAGELCKAKGYEIVRKEGESTPTATGTQYGVMAGATVTRSIVIRCKQ